MQFVWGGDRAEKNTELYFTYFSHIPCDTLTLCAVDFFRVWADGKFVSYGPERTAAGYARPRTVKLNGAKNITVIVAAYNAPCYACDMQPPFFGAEITANGKTVAETEDFKCQTFSARIKNVPRYSYQRGFTEVYDFTNAVKKEINAYKVDAPVIIEGGEDRADYIIADFDFIAKSDFTGFNKVNDVWWKDLPLYAPQAGEFNVYNDFIAKTRAGYSALDYSLTSLKTGFIRLTVNAQTEVKIFGVFDEILQNGEISFRRSGANDFICYTLPAGRHEVTSAEPYAFKYLKLIYKGDAQITPGLITYENGFNSAVTVSGDERISAVMKAAEATFRHNAVDIFTDCPGRERAGWLCDSYFTAKAERLFTGENAIEKRFLQNFILGEVPEIAKNMLPDCFPAQHPDAEYIPNWAMWFVIELYDYYLRTGDGETVVSAKNKVYGLVEFFEKYLNEYGLLENLDGWVFLEWSMSNDSAYVAGVNFPTNMLYALMLQTIDALYGDKRLGMRANEIRDKIYELAYNGEFYVDNALREGEKLMPCNEHISETCQYYALFTGMRADKEFARKIITEFGPLRCADTYEKIGKSNMFIGNYLRFLWLCDAGEYDRVLDECLAYFSSMAQTTGTLWENDTPSASCDHGFASCAAVIILRCLTGYETVINGNPVFNKKFVATKKRGVRVSFAYNDSAPLICEC